MSRRVTGRNYWNAHLGDSVKTLGEGYDILHLVDVVDTLLNALRVLGARALKNRLDAVDVAFGPLLVGSPDSLFHAETIR